MVGVRRAGHRRWSHADVPDQGGRVVVITGATGGLGIELTRALATAGAHVVLAVRDVRRGEDAAARVRRTGARGTLEVRRLDVADLASVRDFAAATDRVDVLVNNAGVMGGPPGLSVDGFERQLATNHLGHFALANLLLPRLNDRVVTVGSASHRAGVLAAGALEDDSSAFPAYARSKLAQLLFLAELQRRLTAAGSTLRSVGGHPGYTATGIQGGTGNALFTRIGALGNALVGMRPWQGALPVLYAATMDVPGNSYLGPDGPFEMLGHPTYVGRSPAAGDPDLARAVWSESEQLTGVAFPL